MAFNNRKGKNLYQNNSLLPFRLSRSKIDLFLECPRCFYLDRKLGVSRPDMPGFSLNSAVDVLLKNEFDLLRKDKKAHQLMSQYGIDAIPYDHPDLPIWRDDVRNYVGVSVIDRSTNFEVCGIIDDVWVDKKNILYIVDYKSTSTSKEISLDDQYKQGYKKQMEVYQWIFRKKNFQVSDTGYFVFANASKDRSRFDGRLEFKLSILPYRGNSDWVDETLKEIAKILASDKIPASAESCEYCQYREQAKEKITRSKR